MKNQMIMLLAQTSVLSLAAAEMTPPEFRIPVMRTAPVVDGRVGADEWKDAAAGFGFCIHPEDELADIDSDFKIGRTADRIYFAAVSDIGPVGLKREQKPRRGNVDNGRDDTYEIVLVPDTGVKNPDVRHLIVNFNGAYRIQTMLNGQMAAWIPETLETKSAVVDGRWHFEFSLALDEIGFAKAPADRHAIRFCRSYKSVIDQWGYQASLRPNDGGFFTDQKTIPLVFDDDAVGVTLATTTKRAQGVNIWHATVRLANPTKSVRRLDVKVEGRPVNSQPGSIVKQLELKPGEEIVLPVEGPILNDEKIRFRAEVRDTERNTRVYFREFMWHPNGPAPRWLAKGETGAAVKFDFAYYPSYDKMRLRADLSTVEKRPASVTVALRTDIGDRVLAKTTLKLDQEGVADEVWEVPDLKAETLRTQVGGYSLQLVAEGVEKGTVFKSFRRDVFEWEGNKLGLSDTIPAPFTPVRREKVGQRSEVRDQTAGEKKVGEGVGADHRAARSELEKISVVLRDHIVDRKTGLWQQVIAQGKELLARPMRIVEIKKVGGESRSTEDGKFHCSPSPSTFTFSSLWDVDGMMEWKLTLAPGHYEPMALEIPIRAERAKLLHPCADGMRFNYAGVVPPGEGVVWDSSKAPRVSIVGDYLPYIWIGGPLRGIAVFGENDRGWVLGEEKKVGGESRSTADGKIPLSTSTSSLLSYSRPCQEVIREADGTVVLRLNLIQKPVDIAEARTIRLGFQATPVKPMEKNWRSSPVGSLIGACLYWGAFTACDDIHPYDGTDMFWKKMGEARKTGKVDKDYLERVIRERVSHCPTNSPDYARSAHSLRAHYYSGMTSMAWAFKDPQKFVWYTNARGVRLGNPEGTTFADEWTVEPFLERPFAWDLGKAYSLDPCRSYLDFAAWWWNKAFDYGIVDYYYWDDVFCQSNFALAGTDAYRLPDGTIQPSSGIFNMREQVRRCAVLQAEKGLVPYKNWVHMTNTAMAPVMAFAGMQYDWEDVAGNSAIQERYSRELIQAASLGRQFGNQVCVMGYFAETDPNSKLLQWLERTGTGAIIAHEQQWMHVKTWQKAHKKLVDWGYRLPTTKVWNYWDEDIPFPVTITGGKNAALAMAKAGNEAVIVVSDWEKGGDYTVKPDFATLGLKPGFTAYDLETGKPLPVTDGCVSVRLARLDYVMIGLK